jgi:hypothetical protein
LRDAFVIYLEVGIVASIVLFYPPLERSPLLLLKCISGVVSALFSPALVAPAMEESDLLPFKPDALTYLALTALAF